MKHFLLAIACLVSFGMTAVLPVATAQAAVTLPNYAAGGNVQVEIQNKGKKATDLVVMVVAIIAIIGMAVGAGNFAAARPEDGKKWVLGGIVGLVIAGSIYGIAALFV